MPRAAPGAGRVMPGARFAVKSGVPTSAQKVKVNRAPVLTLWAAVVAERIGHDREAALTLGRAVAGLNAQSKGRRLGVYHEPSEREERPRRRRSTVELLGHKIPVTRSRGTLRALDADDRAADPAAVERYLESKLGDALPAVRDAMEALAAAMPEAELVDRAYELYEAFRPKIPSGERGWGARGTLDLGRLRKLAEDALATAGRAASAPARAATARSVRARSRSSRPRRS